MSVQKYKNLKKQLKSTEVAMHEIAKLNEFSRRINAMTDLDDILGDVFNYVGETFGIEGVWILKVDNQKKEVYTIKITRSMGGFPVSAIRFVQKFRVSLINDPGSFAYVVNRKKSVYVRKINPDRLSPSDKTLVEKIEVKSVLQIPLIIGDQVIAVACFTRHKHKMDLSLEDIAAITRFCDQVAGAIHTSTLLRQLQEEKTRADKLRGEVEALNDFSRRLNESMNLDEILPEIFDYIKNKYQLDAVILGLPDKRHEHLYFYRASREEDLSQDQLKFLREDTVPLGEGGGLVAKTYWRKKPFYMSRLGLVDNPTDKKLVKTLDIQSFLMVPLVVHDHPVGMLFLARQGAKKFKLDRSQIFSIQRFCEQIAGAINSTSLFKELHREREKSEKLLLNILPQSVADELKENGFVLPKVYDSVTVVFTDFVGFTNISEKITPSQLVKELDGCFSQFDEVVSRNHLEKLKTIGDAYMCAGGLPLQNRTHPVDACLAALEFRSFLQQMRSIKQSMNLPFWELRIGINTGPVTAGVIGKNKFAFDIWGDTVNTASRMESAGAAERVNISVNTWSLVKDFFDCEYRGKVQAKGKGMVDMYFLQAIKKELCLDDSGRIPNKQFMSMYEKLSGGLK